MHVCCLYYVYAYLNIDASLGTSERRRGRGHDMSGGRDSVPEGKNFEFCIFYSRIFHTHMYNVCFYVLCFQLERKKGTYTNENLHNDNITQTGTNKVRSVFQSLSHKLKYIKV